jgi:ribosomal-protein-alanine N-acetyltransferase
MQRITYRLRPISDEDIPQVTEIDHESFPGEWLFHSYTSYKQEIHNSSAHYIVACIRSGFGAKLAREDSREISWLNRLFDYRRAIPAGKEQSDLRTKEYVVGFAGLWALLNEVHIIAVAVRNNYRRMGIGEGLLISTIEMASQLNANVITLEVRASNEIAQALYKKYGFRIVSSRPKYYSDNDEDAILMSTGDITSAPFQSCFQRLKEAHRQKCEVFTTQLV